MYLWDPYEYSLCKITVFVKDVEFYIRCISYFVNFAMSGDCVQCIYVSIILHAL